jgi:hypothetical protein
VLIRHDRNEIPKQRHLSLCCFGGAVEVEGLNLPSALYRVGMGTLCLTVPGMGYSGPQSSGGMKSVNPNKHSSDSFTHQNLHKTLQANYTILAKNNEKQISKNQKTTKTEKSSIRFVNDSC